MPDRPSLLSALVTLAKARTAHQQGLFGAPRLESVRAHTRQTPTGTVFVGPHIRRVRHFASGSQSPGQPTGFAEVGKDVGVAALEVGPKVEAELMRLKGRDAHVFVDSGAFSEVEFGPTGPRTVRPFTPADWDRVLGLYERLAPVLGAQLHVVAPDKVGDQHETLARLARYAPRLRALRAHGVNILVPLQQGAMTLAEFDAAVEAVIGDRAWTPAIPSKKDATPKEAIAGYVAAKRPPLLHLLGLGPSSPRAPEVLRAIKYASPDTDVQFDSNVIRAAVGRPEGRQARPYTWGQDRAAEDLAQQAHFGDYRDDDGGLDASEMLEDVAGWMDAPARRSFVAATGMTGETALRFLRDPDEVLAEPMDGPGGEDGPTWAQVFDHDLTEAWYRHAAARFAPERRRIGIHYAWGGREQEG